ncbi:hypothetical protein, partial [Cobetia sp.]
MSDYTQGVCHDGAAILKDGMPLTIEEILEVLRERDQLDELLKAAGIDAQEIKAENQQLRNKRDELNREVGEEIDERDALAAHVVELVKGGRALHDELQQWSLTERDPETSAAMAKWRTVVGEQPSLSPLYRLAARMKAEALEEAADMARDEV